MFLDASFEQLHNAERRMSEMFSVFAVLAIAIACLGLFGLAAYTAEQRTKEIGVRKVLGASACEHLRARCRGSSSSRSSWPTSSPGPSPVTCHVRRGCRNFAYRVEVGWGIFPACRGGGPGPSPR